MPESDAIVSGAKKIGRQFTVENVETRAQSTIVRVASSVCDRMGFDLNSSALLGTRR